VPSGTSFSEASGALDLGCSGALDLGCSGALDLGCSLTARTALA
jgi:hypothetical protein